MSNDDDNTQSFVTLSKGTMVAHYRIVEKIGAGGMGEVYLAEDTELDRKVALKFLSPHLCQDDDCRARFKREAQAAAKLDNPNIVTVYDVGIWQDRPFFAMQHVEGHSIREAITELNLSVARITDLALQICSGLQAAHEAGVVHRDIKPSNILIDSHGRARIVDFGLAVVIGADHITKSGSTLGTIGYMSPEQVKGHEVDQRSDLFSFGVVVYQMITGQEPFKHDTEAATLNAILNDSPPPLARYRRDVAPGLQSLVDKALEKDPQTRYQTAADIIADFKRLARQSTSGDGKGQPSIAVLPFANMSADPEQEYFCDGMAEEIINALTRLENLRVIARTSAFAFKGKQEDVREIGRQLGVGTLLEGSVRKAGNRLRITAQLVDTTDGSHLWSERYDREMEDIFAIQDEISTAIVEKLKVKLFGGEHEQIVKRPTDNLEAYNLYLKGRFHWNNRSPKEVERAIECLKKAVELDPGFALGYAGLSDAYIIQSDNFHVREKRLALRALAEKTVFKALELDNSLAEAHAALAQIRFSQWKWHESEKEHLSAIRLNPRYATVHHWYSIFLAAQGNFAQSWEHINLARELDPLSVIMIANQASMCYIVGRHDKALEICREGFELNAAFPSYSWITGMSLVEKGDYNEAMKHLYRSIELAEKELPGENDPFRWTPYIGRALAIMGEYDKAKGILDDTIKMTKDQRASSFTIATLCFAIGEMDRGFEWLERSVEEQEFFLPTFRFSPLFDGVRNDPRFLSLIRRIGLDQDVREMPDD